MERHRCKLCSKTFNNGRALGGHMRSHLAALPLPPKKTITDHLSQLGDRTTHSDSSSTQSEKLLAGSGGSGGGSYALRENPKRTAKGSADPDPALLDAGSVVVQDRESETESTQPPTRKRSRRPGQGTRRVRTASGPTGSVQTNEVKGADESVTESTTQVSSVSDASQDEEVALSLMMLSRDVWERKIAERTKGSTQAALLKTTTRPAAKFKCLACKKTFRTNRALDGHKATSKECHQENNRANTTTTSMNFGDQEKDGIHKIYECPFCCKVFGSGQALGGHKRSHLLGSSSSTTTTITTTSNLINVGLPHHRVISSTDVDRINLASSVDDKVVVVVGDTSSFVLDLNLPAPVEDDDDNQDHS